MYYLDADQRKTLTVLENAFVDTTNKEIVARMMTLLPREARSGIYRYLAWDASFLAQKYHKPRFRFQDEARKEEYRASGVRSKRL
jgi:hypothetical protein